MFAFIEGKVDTLTPTHVVLNVGGVGYAIFISLNTYSEINNREHLRLFTHLHIREDAHLLYGFATENERNVFLQLIAVSGVGANTARMMLSSQTADEIKQAIINGDVVTIQRIKGIGPKTAQRVILELRDQMIKLSGTEPNQNILSNTHNKIQNETLYALQALGFNKAEAEKAISKTMKENPQLNTVESLIKSTLKNL